MLNFRFLQTHLNGAGGKVCLREGRVHHVNSIIQIANVSLLFIFVQNNYNKIGSVQSRFCHVILIQHKETNNMNLQYKYTKILE